MSLWKKVAGGVMTTTLTASLLLTVAGTALANTAPQALDSSTCVPANCTQVVGTGAIKISSTANTFPAANSVKLTISGAGATFIDAVGFTLETGTVVDAHNAFYLSGEVLVPTGAALVPASDYVLVTGTTAGTATITEWTWIAAQNVWAPDGNTWTLTFTAAASFQIVAANSTVATYSNNTCTTASSVGNTSTAGTTVGYLGVTVKNGASTPAGVQGATISGNIQPFGTISGAQVYSAVSDANGKICLPIISAGLSGKSTITAQASYLGVTTTLPSVSFTFAGALAKLTASPDLALAAANGTITATGTDANGNAALLTSVTATVSSGLTVVTAFDPATGKVVVRCTTPAVQSKETVSFSDGTIKSNTVNVWCVGANYTATKITVTPAKASLAAGGTTTFTAAVVDANGYPAPDGTVLTGVASAGLVVGDGSTASYNAATTAAGTATFTYFSQNTTGPVTLTAVGAGLAGAATVTVGAGTPGTVSFGPTGSALGNTTVGPFTVTTKIQSIGGYITWKVDGGAALAGQKIEIWVYKKYSALGAWAGPTMLTTRIANSSGVAYVNIHTGGILWLSLRPVLPASGTNLAVWGPTSIGRWR